MFLFVNQTAKKRRKKEEKKKKEIRSSSDRMTWLGFPVHVLISGTHPSLDRFMTKPFVDPGKILSVNSTRKPHDVSIPV